MRNHQVMLLLMFPGLPETKPNKLLRTAVDQGAAILASKECWTRPLRCWGVREDRVSPYWPLNMLKEEEKMFFQFTTYQRKTTITSGH